MWLLLLQNLRLDNDHRLSGRVGPAHTTTLQFPDQSPQYIHVPKMLESIKGHSGRQSGLEARVLLVILFILAPSGYVIH